MLAPTKKELMPILKIYIIVYALTVLTGTRGTSLYFALFLFIYLLSRDYISKLNGAKADEIFLTKRVKRIVIISVFPLLAFMGLFASFRNGDAMESSGLTNDVAGFFIQQGGSYNVIGYSKDYQSSLPPTNVSYTFGPVINKFKYGTLGRIIGNKPLDDDALPLYGNNIAATATWLYSPAYYYNGQGLGAQYIAELYADFGYWGVFFFSFILGAFISLYTFFNTKYWILSVLFAYVLDNIISMPRDQYIPYIDGIFSILNIGVLIIIDNYASKQSRRIQTQIKNNEGTLDN